MRIITMVVAGIAALTQTPAFAGEGLPSGYPNRPVRVIVPQSPGGASDLNARLVAGPLSERLGQSIVIDNRAGAGSLIGTELVAKSAPDGYTFLAISSSITIIPSVYKSLPFDPEKDFLPVTLLSSYPHLVVVPPSLQVNSIKDLIALAKSKPGSLNYGSAGTGTPTQLGAELFKSMAGVNIVHVAYKGGGPALVALLGGEVQVYFGPMPTVLTHVKANKLKLLAVTSITRSTALPDTPTIAEAGLPGFRQDAWNGLLAPARTPAAIVKKITDEIVAVLRTPAIRDRYAAEGVELGGTSSAEFSKLFASEITKWRQVVKQAGIKPE